MTLPTKVHGQYIGDRIIGKTTVNSKSSTSGGIRTIRHGECEISVNYF